MSPGRACGIASRKPGETVKLEVLRGGDTMKIDVRLSSRPVEFDANGRELESQPDDDATVASSGEGLGMTVQPMPPAVRQNFKMKDDAPGMLIVSVDPESDAAEEGLGPRAVITSIDDKPVGTVAEWNRVVHGLKPGETAKLDVVAGGQTAIVFVSVPQPKSK